MQVRCAGSLGAAACAWVYDVVDWRPTRDTRAAWLTAHHTSAATALFPWSCRLDLRQAAAISDLSHTQGSHGVDIFQRSVTSSSSPLSYTPSCHLCSYTPSCRPSSCQCP